MHHRKKGFQSHQATNDQKVPRNRVHQLKQQTTMALKPTAVGLRACRFLCLSLVLLTIEKLGVAVRHNDISRPETMTECFLSFVCFYGGIVFVAAVLKFSGNP